MDGMKKSGSFGDDVLSMMSWQCRVNMYCRIDSIRSNLLYQVGALSKGFSERLSQEVYLRTGCLLMRVFPILGEGPVKTGESRDHAASPD